jgi:hypothetical protein
LPSVQDERCFECYHHSSLRHANGFWNPQTA